MCKKKKKQCGNCGCLSFHPNLCLFLWAISSRKLSDFASCYSSLISDYREHATKWIWLIGNSSCPAYGWKLLNDSFFGVISCTFFAIANTGLSPALLLIGLISVKGQMVEDLYLTALTVIILFSAGQMDIKRYIRATKSCEMCLSFYSARRCLCVLTDEVGLKCNRQGSFENDFFIEKPSPLYPCKCFCKRGINSHYLHQSRLFIWTPPPCTHTQSMGQRSHSHPHITSHYFQPNFQHVNGLM